MKESEGSAPGEKPQFLGVREQRVTNVLVGVAIGLSIFITPILALIPMPVLYGVFLFMGVSALKVTRHIVSGTVNGINQSRIFNTSLRFDFDTVPNFPLSNTLVKSILCHSIPRSPKWFLALSKGSIIKIFEYFH